MRAIVIGSGIAGLSAAIALRKVGIDAAVYERAPELREVGAGISIWLNALRALDHIGAGAAVRAASLRLVHSETRVADGHRLVLGLRADAVERRSGLPELVRMAHRADLVAALASHLPAGVARYGHECVAVEGGERGAAARFANGHTDSADVVIGADGIRSAVRASLFGPEPPRYAGYTCWRGIAPRPAALAAGYVGEWWGRGQRLGISTLPGDRVYWYATRNAPPLQAPSDPPAPRWPYGRQPRPERRDVDRRPPGTADRRRGPEPDERAFLVRAFAGWAEPAAALIEATPPGHIIRNDICDRPPLREWSKGRVGLVGDAAHPTTPNLGQGGCMAVEDAVVLARHLATAPDPGRALAGFAAERHPRTSAISRDSDRFGRLGQLEGRAACRVRDAALRALMPAFGVRGFLKHARYDTGPLPA